MFFRILAFFAIVAVAFASPKPEPEPQVVAYTAPAAFPAFYGSGYVPAAYTFPYAYNPYFVR